MQAFAEPPPTAEPPIADGRGEKIPARQSKLRPNRKSGDRKLLAQKKVPSFSLPPVTARTAPAPRVEDPPEVWMHRIRVKDVRSEDAIVLRVILPRRLIR